MNMTAAIKKALCEHYLISQEVLMSGDKSRVVAFPRQVGMYLVRTQAKRSLLETAQAFNRCNHSTVLFAIGKVVALEKSDPSLREQIETIRKKAKEYYDDNVA